MEYYVILVVVTVIISVCLSLAFFDAMYNTNEFRVRYNKERSSMWQRINEALEANDILKAHVLDVEQKIDKFEQGQSNENINLRNEINKLKVVDDGK